MTGKLTHRGKVILAGAGPGDPELITLKTVRYLQQADVVLTDRLVSEDILSAHVKPNAEIIYVGKQSGQERSTPQDTINELLVFYARQDKLVVRLKGGDVSFFSNILDELQILVENNIAYEIVPGITAASGAAAMAGIPLTARGYSTAVRFLTCYKSNQLANSYWQELAATNDTLVFYMSSETLDTIVKNLVANGIARDVMLAVIEQATTPFQNVHTWPIHEYTTGNNKSYVSPSLVIIGKVVALHEQFNWLDTRAGDDNYFKPVDQVIEQVKLSA
ncbi:uroporphyrinogen-III C-methyltransferase [Segetibacter sp. 3557_3]|uniref:uroporphyrinogen-III C-methyltransferase n=1 Tax=Segetibacter sp. 3557_3 TaxID=2547429 RepID=UPI001058619E|nr:uroporphyrinogen-III C-methyltransferase [Segetibacter sp. 3557_3]TDH25659.1 uroporphyrinogen-III C-methyltransferase [Segetibacter sp. 3557_3]